ncbi:MAG: type II secretion system protein [bacterium]
MVRDKKGFTLVELLIVIVILGILAAIVIARFAGATKDSKEANLKANLREMRSAIEAYKAYSMSNGYPPTLDDLWDATEGDVYNNTFLERIPIDPFYRSHDSSYATGMLMPGEDATARDAKIDGGGGWAYDSTYGRVCLNVESTDTLSSEPADVSWGTSYNLW